MDQVAHRRGGHSPVPEQVVDAGIDRNHAVKDAGLRVDVELNQDLRPGLGHRSVPIAQPAKGCLTVSFWAVTSLGVGRFFIARSIASLVAL